MLAQYRGQYPELTRGQIYDMETSLEIDMIWVKIKKPELSFSYADVPTMLVNWDFTITEAERIAEQVIKDFDKTDEERSINLAVSDEQAALVNKMINQLLGKVYLGEVLGKNQLITRIHQGEARDEKGNKVTLSTTFSGSPVVELPTGETVMYNWPELIQNAERLVAWKGENDEAEQEDA